MPIYGNNKTSTYKNDPFAIVRKCARLITVWGFAQCLKMDCIIWLLFIKLNGVSSSGRELINVKFNFILQKIAKRTIILNFMERDCWFPLKW